MNGIAGLGKGVVEGFFALADLLKEPWAPGLAALVLVVLLAIAIALSWRVGRARTRALARARGVVEAAGDARAFAARLDEVTHSIRDAARDASGRALAQAWDEYRETTVVPDDDAAPARNALRPSQFINTEDLGFGPGPFRIVPGLFVTVGLALTFLGLISALRQVGEAISGDDAQDVVAALQVLLTVASAKFIMSLTGIACSIVFTVWLRARTGAVEHELRRLCDAIEARFSFISLEDVAQRQLREQEALKSHLQELNTQLVAELGKTLNAELSTAVGEAIGTRLEPMLRNIGDAGAKGVDDMVGSLSERLSRDVGDALQQSSAELGRAADRLAELASGMESGAGRMGQEMEGAVRKLVDAAGTLETGLDGAATRASATFSDGAERLLEGIRDALNGIRESSAGTAEALASATQEMSAGAAAFRRETESAGQAAGAEAATKVREAAEAAATDVRAAMEDVGARTLEPLQRIAEALESAVEAADRGTGNMARFAERTSDGASAAERAAAGLRQAAEAAAPFTAAAQRIETAAGSSARASEAAAEAVTSAAQELSRASRAALESAETALAAEREAVSAALDGVRAALETFKGLVEKHEDVDVRLGRALETFNDEVDRTVQSLTQSNEQLRSQHAEALETLQQLVDQLQPFEPETRRGR